MAIFYCILMTIVSAPFTGAGVVPMRSGVDCGAELVEGKLTVNCSGSYSVLASGKMEVHDCSGPEKTYYTPISVTIGKCTSLLLDHASCSSPGSPCSAKVKSISEVLALVVVGMGGFVGLLLVLVAIFLCKSKSKIRRVSWRERKVYLKRSEDTVGVTFMRMAVLCILVCGTAQPTCVEPSYSAKNSEGSTYWFRLRVGQSACFEDGQVEHKQNRESFSLDHLYDTQAWASNVWSVYGCGNGEHCGTRKECSTYGSVGKVIARQEGPYKKVCRTHSVPWFSCISYWACWLATLEVKQVGDPFRVYSIGQSQTQDLYKQSGMPKAIVSETSQATPNLVDKYIVTEPRGGAWLCPRASDRGFPKVGKLGDLQITNKSVLFDFEAFVCELDSQASSGSCEVAGSFINVINGWCEQLPLLMEGGELGFRDGELVLEGAGFDDFRIHFPGNETPVVSSHNCHSKEVRLVGFKDDNGLFMYVFRADSSDNSSWIVQSSCIHEPLEITCDGRPVAYHLSHTEEGICTFDGTQARDDRVEVEPIRWVWHGEAATLMAGTTPHWVAFLLLATVAGLLVRCMCK